MQVAGIILAGGLSSRMGRDKALVSLGGRALIAHVVARLAPQVGRLAVSANGDPARFASFGLPVLPDADDARPGPLAGIVAGLAWARAAGAVHLVTGPCDAPFLPLDLVACLGACEAVAADRTDRPVVASGPNGLEPLFALWPVAALPEAETALASGERSVHRLLARLGAVACPLADTSPPWWLNINSAADLAVASGLGGAGQH